MKGRYQNMTQMGLNKLTKETIKKPLKIGRREFNITDKDVIFDNGVGFQLTTQTYYSDWANHYPSMSKSQFNKLYKLGILFLVEEKFAYKMTNGKDVYYKYYKFNINKLNETL